MAAWGRNTVSEESLFCEWCPFWDLETAPELCRPGIVCHDCVSVSRCVA
jgi:hypothetical protein